MKDSDRVSDLQDQGPEKSTGYQETWEVNENTAPQEPSSPTLQHSTGGCGWENFSLGCEDQQSSGGNYEIMDGYPELLHSIAGAFKIDPVLWRKLLEKTTPMIAGLPEDIQQNYKLVPIPDAVVQELRVQRV